MSGDEGMILLIPIGVAAFAWYRWYAATRVRTLAIRNAGRLVFTLSPIICLFMLFLVLVWWSAADVRESVTYLTFYMIMGAGWLGFCALWLGLLGRHCLILDWQAWELLRRQSESLWANGSAFAGLRPTRIGGQSPETPRRPQVLGGPGAFAAVAAGAGDANLYPCLGVFVVDGKACGLYGRGIHASSCGAPASVEFSFRALSRTCLDGLAAKQRRRVRLRGADPGAGRRVRIGTAMERKRILVTGRVQGVGFRPTVHRLAAALELSGFVLNDTRGVTMELQGQDGRIEEFLRRLTSSDKPPLARIQSCEVRDLPAVRGRGRIHHSREPQRGDGAFGGLGRCGRLCGLPAGAWRQDGFPLSLSIHQLHQLRTPVLDHQDDSLRPAQHHDVGLPDVRAVRGPVSRCGGSAVPRPAGGVPGVRAEGLARRPGRQCVANRQRRGHRRDGRDCCGQGRIVAIKGLGGFHLACDALNNDAVLELRRRKRRDFKPFAMMAGSVEEVRKYADGGSRGRAGVDESGEPRSCCCRSRRIPPIAPAVAQGVNSFGFMLCYAPLHHLLFAEGLDLLVMTSANISDEPLICRNELALERLGDVADAFLMHDREIYRQVDDSIVYFVAGERVVLRRARGYVPTPILMQEDSPQEILAAGADMKNTFCLVKRQSTHSQRAHRRPGGCRGLSPLHGFDQASGRAVRGRAERRCVRPAPGLFLHAICEIAARTCR